MFDIAAKDAERQIEVDRLRSEEAKREDIAFLLDQRNDRKMVLGTKDEKYESKVNAKIRRLSLKSQVASSEVLLAQPSSSSGLVSSLDISLEENIGHDYDAAEDEDYGKNMRKPPQSKTVTLEMPTDIIKKTAMTAERFKISSRGQTMLMANIVNQCGGKIDEIKCSQTYANRKRKSVVKDVAATIREDFKEDLEKI